MPYDQRALAALTQPDTLFTGNAFPRPNGFDFGNIPGLNNNIGMAISIALQPLLMGITQQYCYAGLQFGGTQNALDTITGNNLFVESRRAIQESLSRDRDQFYRQLLGFARMTGTRIGPDQRRAAGAIADDLSSAGVILG